MQYLIPREVYNELSSEIRTRLFDYLTFVGIDVQERPIYFLKHRGGYAIFDGIARGAGNNIAESYNLELLDEESILKLTELMP